ncbi:hypothetical protein CGC20_38690 [Leishmania donovani]|uniref:Uncharacterized protein n=1 Tax=Leishmania donovani TaxID=5661 RepID=A0A504Y0G0_LEIDO|nr:hypothetical protein CGC20_38690 [Leishmania donovani]
MSSAMWYTNCHRQAVLNQRLAGLGGWMQMAPAVVFGTQWELQRHNTQMAKAAAAARQLSKRHAGMNSRAHAHFRSAAQTIGNREQAQNATWGGNAIEPELTALTHIFAETGERSREEMFEGQASFSGGLKRREGE